MRLLAATTNPDKLREIRHLLEGVADLATLADFSPFSEPVEDGVTFEENARIKALHYASAAGVLTVAEDSGLEIDALAGAPGVHSARYGGRDSTYPEKFGEIYRALGPARDSTARFVCALALAESGRIVFETRGVVEGSIAPEPRGRIGFGYDPIFFYPPFNRTLAEVSRDEKCSVSHRGKAFAALREFLLQH